MRFREIGQFREDRGVPSRDRGCYLEAVERRPGTARYLAVSNFLIPDEDLRRLRAGEVVDLPWVREEDLRRSHG